MFFVFFLVRLVSLSVCLSCLMLIHCIKSTLFLCSASNARLYLAAFSAVLGNFSFGYAMVYPSPVIPQLQQGDDPRLKMDTQEISWFGVRSFMVFGLFVCWL